VHQGNVKSTGAKHLAWKLFQAFPYANVYKDGARTARVVGAFEIRESAASPSVVVLYGQRYPGASKWNNDTPELRMTWFESALNALGRHLRTLEKPVTLAFPHKIGCGAAGGDWTKYRAMLDTFERTWSREDAEITVTIVKLENE